LWFLQLFSCVFSSRCSRHNYGGINTKYRHCTTSTEASTSSLLVTSSLLSTYITATSESLSKTWYSKVSRLMIYAASFSKAACTPLHFFLAVCNCFPLWGMIDLSQQLRRVKGHTKMLTALDDACCLYSSLASAAPYFN